MLLGSNFSKIEINIPNIMEQVEVNVAHFWKGEQCGNRTRIVFGDTESLEGAGPHI